MSDLASRTNNTSADCRETSSLLKKPIIIAHRGASGYLPEHSLGAKALAYGMGADYLEQDVIATRDGELVILHDLVLDAVSDVRDRFPGRARADGLFYCLDFDLAELRTLRFHERIDLDTGVARYPGRFASELGHFGICTLAEEIAFIDELNRATGREVGIYPEIKNPQWHLQQGFDLTSAVIGTLEDSGYLEPGRRIFLQCYDPDTLRSCRDRQGPELPIIQLISSKTIVSNAMLVDIATYATGIGPSLGLIYSGKDARGAALLSTLVQDAQALGLAVHPYTFRADDLPAGVANFTELLALCVDRLGVDGLFTDFTDLAVAHART